MGTSLTFRDLRCVSDKPGARPGGSMKFKVGWVALLGALLVQSGAGCVGRATQSMTGPEKGAGQQSETWIFRKVRRLSNREYNNVVRDLRRDPSQPANSFLDDSYANGYDNGSAL